MHASSSLRKQTVLVRVRLLAYFFMQPRQLNACQQQPLEKIMLVRVPLSAYFFMQPRQLNACQQQPLEKNYVGSSPTIGIFLYVAQAVECVLAVAFGTHNTHNRQTSMLPVGFEPTISAGEGPQSARPLGPVKYRTYAQKMKMNTLSLKRDIFRN